MRDTTDNETERDRGGRFVKGGKPGPGRPVGSRSRLGEAFIADLHDAWEQHGPDVIARVARDDPAALLRVVASLMPKDIRLDASIAVGFDAAATITNFREAVKLLQADAPASLKVIDAK